ncbi:hypothetical protein PGT21_035894 [Puccinia graminis f. sp. tritici]|uniref:Uncharacterized protein n=1 Tax=Puccinia graminis f. sp. tritici TaxID=56615 RepID=A0A5B0Q0C5_PUCGR|nr:hypothetical protein PGT21_035894 [Puccinia graminis f. sp. tritici]KAA1126278.1 hypothetical protein PGTUg99_023349 [Puccinia graminis f. sp. tritici]
MGKIKLNEVTQESNFSDNPKKVELSEDEDDRKGFSRKNDKLENKKEDPVLLESLEKIFELLSDNLQNHENKSGEFPSGGIKQKANYLDGFSDLVPNYKKSELHKSSDKRRLIYIKNKVENPQEDFSSEKSEDILQQKKTLRY